MILHFAFSTIEFERTIEDDIDDIMEIFNIDNIFPKLNSCDYNGDKNEILISNDIFIPRLVYNGKIFYDIMFEEDPKNVFIETYNDTDPEMLTGISEKGISLFNNFNNGVKISPSVNDLFINPKDPNNEIYGFCVRDIKLSQVLEFNIMWFNGEDSREIKQIYKRDKWISKN